VIGADARLRAAGLRVTQPRLAVLAEVAEHPHADVEAIAAGARARRGSLSTQAVYDIVHALTGAKLLRRIQPIGSPARFELRVGDSHHHLVCRSCGAIADIALGAGHGPPPRPDAPGSAGYVIDETEVTYWGLCPACNRSPDFGDQLLHDRRSSTPSGDTP
jgi:Fur family ferric uptake transcriptional regulator